MGSRVTPKKQPIQPVLSHRRGLLVEPNVARAFRDEAKLGRNSAGRICLALMSAGTLDLWTADSLLSVWMHEQRTGRHHIAAHITVGSGPRIAEGRSQVVEGFLFGEATQGCDWLMLVDYDMTFEADAIEQLLLTALEHNAQIVGGLCFAGGFTDRVFPTLYHFTQEADGEVSTEPVEDYPLDQAVQVGATGAAFLLVHRSVLAKMLQTFGTQPNGNPNPYPWFIEGMTAAGRPYGEDVAFCMRASQLGIKVYVDTRVKVGHRKMRELNETLYLERQAAIPIPGEALVQG